MILRGDSDNYGDGIHLRLRHLRAISLSVRDVLPWGSHSSWLALPLTGWP